MPQLGEQLISHRFPLDDIADAFALGSDPAQKPSLKKMVMVRGDS